MFDKMKQLMEMQKKMQEMKRQLEETDFEIISPDGVVKVMMNGAQEVKSVSIQGELDSAGKTNLEKALKDVYNRAVKESQKIAAQKMKGVVGTDLPGMV
jgi:DNA-binding YbaB/EbfC family protein